MYRFIVASCILLAGISSAAAEDKPVEAKGAKKPDLQVNDIVTILIDGCPTTESSPVAAQSDIARCTRLAANVVGIQPNGVCQIEGRNESLVGNEVWEREMSGKVRRESLQADRSVRSQDIAEFRYRVRKKPMVHDAVAPAAVLPNPVRQVSAEAVESPKIAVLRQKQEELAKLQEEIQQLRVETRTSQQILVHVQMLEFSLTKMQKMGVALPQASSGYFTGSDLSRILTTIRPGEPHSYTPPKASGNDASKLVDWMTDNNIAKVLAEPTILVLEGRPAQFHVGGEIPMPARDNSKVLEYQPFGTQVDLLATSLGDGRVRLELKTSVKEVDDANSVQVYGMKCPRMNVRQIATGIESSFGEPTVLTGMIETRTETIRVTSGVGEVANRVRGKASTRDVTNEICLMLVVTPERVDAVDTAQRTAVEATPK